MLGRLLSPGLGAVAMGACKPRASGSSASVFDISAAVDENEAGEADKDDEDSQKHAPFPVQSQGEAPRQVSDARTSASGSKTYMKALRVPRKRIIRPTQR